MSDAFARGIGPQIVPAEALARPSSPIVYAQPLVRDAMFERLAVGAEAPASTAAIAPTVSVDPADVITALRAERAEANGGFNHRHVDSGCGYCRRAVSAYR